MAADRHKDTGLDAPADIGLAVSANDTTDLPNGATRGLYVGTAGNVTVIFAADTTNSGAGTAVALKNLAAGVAHPFRVRRVYSTGTTATDVVALY